MTIEITEKKEEEKVVQDTDIKETLKQADEYEKLKADNDRMEKEFMRQQELRAKIAIGGQALAGKAEITDEDKAEGEAKKILDMFRT